MAVVVAQLAERSVPTPEIRGSNPNIGNKLFRICQLQLRKDENKIKKTGRGWPIKKLNTHRIGDKVA